MCLQEKILLVKNHCFMGAAIGSWAQHLSMVDLTLECKKVVGAVAVQIVMAIALV